MKNAEVGVIENNEGHILLLQSVLPLDGHIVKAVATNLPDAIELIDDLADGKITLNALIIDGNLHSKDSDTSDAEKITRHLDEQKVLVKRIGYSCCRSFPDNVHVDYYSDKDILKVQQALRDIED